MEKEQIINIVSSMGFSLDYDQWVVPHKEWMRFTLTNQSLDEKKLRLIWWKDLTIEDNLKLASQILFKAGQKYKIQQLSKME